MPEDKRKNFKSLENKPRNTFWGANQELQKEAARWPAFLALILLCLAYFLLSDRLTIGPGWLLFVLILVLLIPAVILRLRGNHRLNRLFLLGICWLVTLAEAISIALLLVSLPDKTVSAVSLLRDAGLLWGSNIVIFSLWYWQVDAGGPYARSHESGQDYHKQAELLFPVFTLKEQSDHYREWRPGFLDYLFVAFNTSTAFSPTDTPVLSVRMKVLSMIQGVISLVTVAALAARAVNLL